MRWSFDYEGRALSTLGYLYDPGTLRESVYSGSCDSFVRKRNDYENDDDDGDSFQKEMIWETAHFMPDQDKGMAVKGNILSRITAYIKSELKAWRLEVRTGEDNAYLALRPSWYMRSRASAETQAGRTRVPKMSHEFTPNVSGEGWILRFSVVKAINIVYSGITLEWREGGGARPRR